MGNSRIRSLTTIPLIFLYAILGILITLIIITIFFGGRLNDDNDIFNWVGLTVEIGAAAGITVAVWHYTKNEQKKTNKLVKDIRKVTEKLDGIINEQNRLQQSRKQFLHESLYGNTVGIIVSAYNISQGNSIRKLVLSNGKEVGQLNEYLMLDQDVEILNEKLASFNDLMTPELYASVSTVRNLLKEKQMGAQYMNGIIDQSKRVLRAIDESLFSKENIAGVEVLEKV